jgi:hypothetical protein
MHTKVQSLPILKNEKNKKMQKNTRNGAIWCRTGPIIIVEI